jgi:predicted SAM-dependent methyltransferase
MRLNLGCGDRYVPEWTNVDLAQCPHDKDLVWDLTGPLPLEWGMVEVTHVYIGHLLEHLPMEDGRKLLTRLANLLRRDGHTTQLMVVGPDCDLARDMAQEGNLETALGPILHGASRWPGDEHHWECTGDAVVAMLRRADWSDVTRLASVTDVPSLWPVADRGPQWQFAIGAQV